MSRKGSSMDNEEGLREAFATFDKVKYNFHLFYIRVLLGRYIKIKCILKLNKKNRMQMELCLR